MSSLSNQPPNQSFAQHRQFISAFQADQQQLSKIKQQNKILTSMYEKVHKKDVEIEELQKLVKKYKKYYEEYDLIAATLAQKNKQYEKLSQENKILFEEMESVVKENKILEEKLLQAEKNKHEYVKDRNSTDKRLRDIEETFREYREECRSKEKGLIADLEKSYMQIKDLNQKCDELQMIKFQNEQLKGKLNANISIELGKSHRPYQSYINNHQSLSRSRNNEVEEEPKLKNEIQGLLKELHSKQIELQRSKALNHELSIEFDKSVSKICEFEKQLSLYRKENHELKRTLSLFVEKEQYEKMHRNKIREHGESEDEQSWNDQNQNNYEEEEDSYRR